MIMICIWSGIQLTKWATMFVFKHHVARRSIWWMNLATLRFLDDVKCVYCIECNSQSILLMVREFHPYFSWIKFFASSSKLTSRILLCCGRWIYSPFTNISKGADVRWIFIGFDAQEVPIVSASTFSFQLSLNHDKVFFHLGVLWYG